MAANADPTEERAEDVAEVEAHSSVLDAQGPANGMDQGQTSSISVVGATAAEV
ncbi:hypothetical protein EDD96_6220 [Streptomyces sp. Ag109_G2-6]|uniref:hypothetical protein n=1 Tax=Streptomyces TaxID=1883 RepID=UPI000FA2B253|nr:MULTISPECIES: hypothetical protein [Streptomyces]RPF29683.1 hypothetical protein EDD96_6220 [Streptomyces sp. Ag109_G2-6]